MSENKIKSEKAKQALIVVHRDSQIGIEHDNFHLPNSVFEAIEIAETEAEERHAKELHELKDKAIKAHRECCSFYSGFDGGYCSRNGNKKACNWMTNDCRYMQNFITELNK